jgi:hypothetical protein
MSELGINNGILRLIIAMLQRNSVTLQDGIQELAPFDQTTGLPQGDNLASILFVILMYFLPEYLRATVLLVIIILFADDIVLMADSLSDLQRALNALVEFCRLNKGHEIQERG